MGDSGSMVIGFGLASLALAASWTVAGTTAATILLPLLVLAIPILDTTLVTIARLVEKRPVTQGGRDHTSHRLVYYGLSETKAVLLLAIVASAIGATALAYNVLDNGRLTAVGVLVTFVLLVQFGSFLSDLEERTRRGVEGPEPSLWRALIFEPRRLAEVFADFVIICASFLAAYALAVGGAGTDYERSVYLSALPILLAARYVFFVALGVYRRVWRFATARDVVPIAVGCFGSAIVAYLILVALRPIGSFPAVEIFVIDAILCTLLVGASRLALRLLPETVGRRGERKRVLVVGAGRAGRSLARELREGRDARVVGFLDDNPRVRRRRILGVSVLGSLDEADRAIASTGADEVLVSIPGAPQERLELVTSAADAAGLPCRLVRRHVELSPPERRRGRADVSTTAKAGGEPRPDFLARFLAAVPLLVLYFALAALYAWQASRRLVPTIFTDELELTQLARAIADTGEPARRGIPYPGHASLVAYVLAPVWWLGSVSASYAAAKLMLVLAMTATIFPAYGLARMVVPKWYALAAAGAAVAVPALAYAPILVEEPLAYPLATLALWLIARALERPTRGRLAAAAAVSVVAMLTRTQLSILFMVLGLGLLWIAWQSTLVRRWRSGWSRWDWVGARDAWRSASRWPSPQRWDTCRPRGGRRPSSGRSGSSSTRPGRSARSRSGWASSP